MGEKSKPELDKEWHELQQKQQKLVAEGKQVGEQYSEETKKLKEKTAALQKQLEARDSESKMIFAGLFLAAALLVAALYFYCCRKRAEVNREIVTMPVRNSQLLVEDDCPE